jgi:hypothetical protein
MAKFTWRWWLIYHGDENPFKIMKEVKEKGYHDCPYWKEDEDECSS